MITDGIKSAILELPRISEYFSSRKLVPSTPRLSFWTVGFRHNRGERKKRASEEKRRDSLGSWGERKKRASEEKRGETVSVVGASEKSGRESEEPTCHNSYLVLESYTYSYPGRDTV